MAAMIGPYFFRFGCVVADEFERYRKLYRVYLIFAIVNAFGIFFTPYYVKGLWSFGVFRYQPLGGLLYPIFTAFFWWCTLHSFLVAARAYKNIVVTHRSQIKVFLLATGIAYSGGGELFFQGFHLPIPSYGIFPILAYVVIIGYAVHKYRFLNVELVLRKTVVFTGLSAFTLGTMAFATLALPELIKRYVQIQQWILTLSAAVLVVLIYEPLKALLINVTDRFLFQKRYDYKNLLRQFTDEVVTVLDLRQLIELTVSTLADTLKLENCAILLPNRVTNRYEAAASVGVAEHSTSLEGTHPLVKLLQQVQEPVAMDFIQERRSGAEVLEQAMMQLKAEVCLPLVLHDELVGILTLGPKKSDDDYTKEDLEILMTVAKTEAIAISNATLAAEASQREKLAVIGTLAAAINHEVCNPLNNIKVQAEGFLLEMKRGFLSHLSKEEFEGKVSGLIQTTMQEIDRTAEITTRLSNFAKPIRDPVSEPVEVGKILDETLRLLGHDLGLREITVEATIPPNFPMIFMDRRQLQEILFNLVRNAGQAIGQKGKLTIRASVKGAERVAIQVVDTGPGMSTAQLQQLFTPFFTTKGEGQGTGLGLFVVRQLVERNGGTVDVQSHLGIGTTFTIEFPMVRHDDTSQIIDRG